MKKYCSKQEILELFINLNVKYINDYIYEYSVDNINFYNSDYYLSNIDEFEALNRITSYNVCYTKLLRVSQLLRFSYPIPKVDLHL